MLRYSREEQQSNEDRKEYLLKVVLDLFQKQKESSYVLDLLGESLIYDGVECDGECLMEDIKIELDLL